MSTSPFSSQSGGTQLDERPLPEERPSAPELVAAAWFVDPLGRFDGRFFDGEKWTEQVSDNGVLRLDPDWAATSTATPSDAGPALDHGERRGTHDRRQITMAVAVERRKGNRRNQAS